MQMSEHYWAPQSNVSNETSTAKTFQRTISAQVCVSVLGDGVKLCFISPFTFQSAAIVLAALPYSIVLHTIPT